MTEDEVFKSETQSFLGDEEECREWPLYTTPFGIQEHLTAFKLFIAARRIQTVWRGYRVRKQCQQRWKAAIVIQRWWLGFRLRRQLWDMFERRLQATLLNHFHRAATRIQALFRGWRDRRHIHDMRGLQRMQIAAAEELVLRLSLCLYDLKKAENLPGIMSIQEGVSVSIYENLVTTMMFRFHNGRMVSMAAKKITKMEEERRRFRKCRFQTRIPYPGHTFNMCPNHYEVTEMDVGNALLDSRLHDIAVKYQDSQRSEYLRELFNISGSKKRKEYLDNIGARETSAKENFCDYVRESMRRWMVWTSLNDDLKTSFFASSDRPKHFFEDVEMVLDEFGVNCNCVTRGFPIYRCPYM